MNGWNKIQAMCKYTYSWMDPRSQTLKRKRKVRVSWIHTNAGISIVAP